MAVQKNFVVKNGIEVNENLIFADKDLNKVGIGTTVTPEKLQVNGGIGATSIVLSGVGTIPISFSNISNIGDAYIVSGVVTSITGTALTYTNADVTNLSVDNAYVVSGVVTNLTGTISTITNIDTTNLVGTIGTFTTADVTNLSVDNAYVVSGVVTNLVGTIGTFTTVDTTNLTADVGYIVSGVVTNLVGTIGTFTTVDTTNLSVDNAYVVSGVVTNLVGTSATIGTVEIVSGIITATSGIVTYYGDGTNLSLAGNSDLVASTGVGIQTGDTLIGYGATFIEFRGPGVSTAFYDSSVGIATIYFQGGGGGGGGAIGIGSTFPGTPLSIDPVPSNGDLFFHIDYGRTFIYYDEVILGVGSSAFWIDSSPFNIGIITAIYGGVAFSDGSAGSPSWYFEDDVTTGVFSPVNGELTFVSTGSSVLNINSSGVVVTGVVTATSFVGDGSGITGISSVSFATTSFGLSGTPNLNVGVVTATSFVGNLTGTASTSTASGTAYGLSGTPNLNVGVVTATSFVGNLTGTASTAGYATTSFGLEGSPAIQVSSASVNTSETPTKLYVSGNAASNVVGLGTTNANTTLDFSTGNNFSLELVGSIVLSNPTGVTTGQSGIILIQQDSSGSRTCGFGSHWDFPSATPPTLSTGANALDALTYFVRSSTSIITNSLIGIGTL